MAPPATSKPGRLLIALIVLLLGGVVWAFWPGTDSSVRLGLDLQGGTQVILLPQPVGDADSCSAPSSLLVMTPVTGCAVPSSVRLANATLPCMPLLTASPFPNAHVDQLRSSEAA